MKMKTKAKKPARRRIRAQLKAAQAKVGRLEGRACLVCGRAKPCGIREACTFDPDPIQAARRFMAERDEARALFLETVPKLGVFVQWMAAGVAQWVEPRRLVAFQWDGGQCFAFCDGSFTGIPAAELTAA